MTAPPTTQAPIPEAKTPFYRNVKVLSWAFQVAVFFIVLAILLWLWGNYLANTEESGIPTNFDFLRNPASFDIPGADFGSTDSVRNAYIVGLLNTIRVSVVGVVLATILGTLIGIGRLSKNWVVQKLSTVYVETIRNTPLLVIMTFTFLGVVLQVLPTIQEAWEIGGLAIFSNRGIGLPWYQGVSGVSLLLVLLVGAVGWWAVSKWRHSVSDQTGAPARAS